VHPGYGFLSENEDFAEACAAAGLVFIGPPVAAIRAMGSKAHAKTLMQDFGVPLVPGYHGTAQDLDTLADAARRIGYPVLVKAVAGGGGKGMRIAERSEGRFEAARGRSCPARGGRASFGDDDVLVEKYLQRPRHIEVQVFGDTQGTVDPRCTSANARPSAATRRSSRKRRPRRMSAERRARDHLGKPALRRRASAVGYTGAGTVEFVADHERRLLLHRDEHKAAGRASGHRDDHGASTWSSGRSALPPASPCRWRRTRSLRCGHADRGACLRRGARGRLPAVDRPASCTGAPPPASEPVRIDTGFGAG
jgi:3-methylcrotonyl-CoA carboxylase alpha subunit